MESSGESKKRASRRSTFDSTLPSQSPSPNASPKVSFLLSLPPVAMNTNNNRSVSVSHISSGGGGGGGGADAILDAETRRKTKRAQRHTIGSIPMRPLEEETTIHGITHKILPDIVDIQNVDIASSMKKKVEEKIKPVMLTSTPFDLLDKNNNPPSPTFLRRQQSDVMAIRPITVGVPSFPPLSALLANRKSRTDSFMTYTSTMTFGSSKIPKVVLSQDPESSKSVSAAVPSSGKPSKSSTSSIFQRLRMGGGAIIAGPLAKDAIEGIFISPFLFILSLSP